MVEQIDIFLDYWTSLVAKAAPWAIILFILRELHGDVSTVSAGSEPALESTAVLMQQMPLFELMIPMILIFILATLTMPLVCRV